MKQQDVLDLHLTRLFGWLVQTSGRAILVAALAGTVVAVLGATQDSVGMIAAAPGIGLLVGALYLSTASAPWPVEVEESGDSTGDAST